jgi:glycerol-3-phosphate acyltransferase PlsX
MDDDPVQALRLKKDSSMRRAIELVRDGTAQACVSAGNTGALLAKARYVLKTLEGIDRPAIMTALPTYTGHTHMLDLGANVDCSAEHLYQFAVMGAEAVAALRDIDRPRVGLLNIGHEAIKGNEQVKSAARLISDSNLNYIGYVEGDAVYKGIADVVVCDGFAGNIALKSSEGAAKMVAHYLRQEFSRTWLTRLMGLVAMPVLRGLRSRIDPRSYNGASLLGLRGIVVKSHGSADALAFANAIQIARLEVTHNLSQRIGDRISHHFGER